MRPFEELRQELDRFRVAYYHNLQSDIEPISATAVSQALDLLQAQDSATAGMAWSEIAASAYRAYAASTGNKNFVGAEMPAWDALPRKIQVAWEVAVRQAGSCAGQHAAPDESRWKGWEPPA